MSRKKALERAAQHILDHMPLAPVPGLAGLLLHQPTPRSGLARLAESIDRADMPPYWAYPWAGGLALAHHLRAHPDIVAGRRVLDLGAGSGLVAIVAAQLGAHSVIAADTDVLARIAIKLNAAASEVSLWITGRNYLRKPLAPATHGCDVILAGDMFYDETLAARALVTLTIAVKAGLTVLVGDPGRKTLPLDRFEQIACYEVSDMGLSPDAPPVQGLVLRPRPVWS